jgi:hypothetical protein
MAKNFNFDLIEIFKYFNLTYNESCEHLTQWLNVNYEFDNFEQRVIDDVYEEIVESGEHMNEEELKIQMVSLVFYAADIKVKKKIKVFYERAMTGKVKDVDMSVICDCLVATPLINAPDVPFFFLQEFKKSKGEKKDPEAQMLIAMLIAQAKNNDGKPIYGGYLIGTGWHFTTLIGNDYCVSRKYEATAKDHLLGIICALKSLKQLILNR